MPNAFNFSASPFDCLSADERALVRDHVDIAYFPEGATILAPGMAPTHLFVVIKGHVRQLDGDEVVTTYGPDDTFDGRALVSGKVGSCFVAADEVLAYQLQRDTVTELISRNATFGALLFAELSDKLSALTERHRQHENHALAMARVAEAPLRRVPVVDWDTDVFEVVELLDRHRTTSVLVRLPPDDDAPSGERLGIFTTTSLHRAILTGQPMASLPAARFARHPLVTAAPGEHLIDALATMIRHRVTRVVVMDGERVMGLLEQVDLLGFASNQSSLITRQILEARDLATLADAAERITRLIALLHRGGTPVSLVAKLVQELNAALFERAWRLVAPRELVENSCLFVMGSEGRGEQLLKTDQDNGLILRDGFDEGIDVAGVCERFSAALRQFGWPDCPGRIMVSNPAWRQHASAFAQTVRRWLALPDTDALMMLAIFLDAHPIAGDAALLHGVRDQIWDRVGQESALLGRVAAAIDLFGDNPGWWNRLFTLGDDERDLLDLKKAGVFPLVHGVRSLSLAYRVPATGTVERIHALVGKGRLPPEVGHELVESLHFFMQLKLKAGLEEMESGHPVSGAIHLDRIGSLDRDLLKDTLGAVKRFKALLRHHFHLEML